MKILTYIAIGGLLVTTFPSCEKDEVPVSNEMMLAEGYYPAWSQDGSKIAYISNDSLFIINTDRTGKTLLTNGAYRDPSWSPSDNYLCYQGENSGFIINRINANGSNKINLVDKTYIPQLPAWSPDGEIISFVGQIIQNNESLLYLVNKDGSNIHAISEAPMWISSYQTPVWSNDGGRILFIAFDEVNQPDIHLINPDGSNLRRLQIDSLWEENAVFANNGNTILFSAAGSIYRINSDGSGLTNLTGNIPGNAYPRSSPDGTMIAFTSYRGDEDGLYTMLSDGSGQQKISGPGVFQTFCAWSPDSRKIAFVTNRAGASGSIYIVKVPE